jgi:hypothetical protein
MEGVRGGSGSWLSEKLSSTEGVRGGRGSWLSEKLSPTEGVRGGISSPASDDESIRWASFSHLTRNFNRETSRDPIFRILEGL